MKISICLFSLAFIFSSCSHKHLTIVKNVDVFDGEQVLKNVDFAFSAAGIEYISGKKKRRRNATVIDGKGKTILPPLVNAHVHVRNSDNLKESLKVGIFGMLDMFSTDARANSLRAYNDSLAYSRFFSSNVGATPPGGHGTQFGVNIPTINDTVSPRQFVMDRVAQNADYIKITQEYSMSRLAAPQLRELIAEAHHQHKLTIVHVSDLQDAIDVAKQNADGLAHIWYRKGSVSKEQDLKLMREKNIFIIPTISVIEKVIKQAEETGLEENYLSFEALKHEVRKLHEQGICLLAGTDSPNFGMDYSSQYFKELLFLKECGLSEIEILKCATVNIYEKFNLQGFARLQTNGEASFLLVTGKPFLKIEDIKNEKRIWKNGVEIS
ncbi:MAG TPA: amidohydrolase family protein [Flavilitoribacter sp.]|nr:amidohydrolase family protein [Flavilitoribacter sp.]HMQ89762.1 amidohydrolase family protein [Flavilitoribacter sp.]